METTRYLACLAADYEAARAVASAAMLGGGIRLPNRVTAPRA